MGKRLVRLDGKKKADGSEIFGADETPAGTLGVRVIRCPYDRARFNFGDFGEYVRTHSGVCLVLTAKDVPGVNCYGVMPKYADQPVFAETEARFRGEAVAAVVGEAEAIEALSLANFPVVWEELPALRTSTTRSRRVQRAFTPTGKGMCWSAVGWCAAMWIWRCAIPISGLRVNTKLGL